jgi:hypothetical protein
MKQHSPETKQFRTLSRDEKFESVLSMCKALGTIPKTYATKTHLPTEAERVRGQFFINMQSAMHRNKLPSMYHHYIEHILAYGNRIDVPEKVDRVYIFYKINHRLPTRKNDDVTLVNQWKSIKGINPNDLPLSRKRRLIHMITFAAQSAPVTKLDRLNDLLAFCTANGRLPKQHSVDISEKKLADFLSTLKQSIKKKPLSKELNSVYKKITRFAPAKRTTNR